MGLGLGLVAEHLGAGGLAHEQAVLGGEGLVAEGAPLDAAHGAEVTEAAA